MLIFWSLNMPPNCYKLKIIYLIKLCVVVYMKCEKKNVCHIGTKAFTFHTFKLILW
ncbi:hypothetical protein Hanom_Chr12g01114321 [Helianthus anomalus]